MAIYPGEIYRVEGATGNPSGIDQTWFLAQMIRLNGHNAGNRRKYVMCGSVFQIRDDGKLVEMFEQPYDSEGRLQELLANYPDILGGKQIESPAPRRWILLKREMRVPSALDRPGRWALDHASYEIAGMMRAPGANERSGSHLNDSRPNSRPL
jgi:hypothetical protein